MLRSASMEDAQPPPPKKRKWLRRLTALAVVLALLGGLFWSGWYVYNRGFTRKWRAQLAAELRRRGLDFSARRLTLNPFEGLTAENVRIYLLDEQHTQLIYVDKVAVDIDLGRVHPAQAFPQFARPARGAVDPARGHGRSAGSEEAQADAGFPPRSISCPTRYA